jgi:hypothetical protein
MELIPTGSGNELCRSAGAYSRWRWPHVGPVQREARRMSQSSDEAHPVHYIIDHIYLLRDDIARNHGIVEDKSVLDRANDALQMPALEPIAHIELTGGALRPIFDTPDGRQYVLDDDGQRVYGVWFIPPEVESEPPLIVDPLPF